MARAKRWTVPFVSLNGTSCRVDIYDEGWTGAVTTLTAAADPFEYEENDDEDLLNGVIRYRTGYLRLIEENYGDLDDVYPSANTDRYIEFYYGNTLDFNGYIQAQEFENTWEPGPRVIELPVISPLGLAGGTKYDYTNYNPPRWLTVNQLIKDSLNLLNGGYAGYYFPQSLPNNPTMKSIITTGLYVNSLTFVPWGNTFYKDGPTGNIDGIYETKTVLDALTQICTTFGVIMHDVPGTPIFQRLDWEGDYFIVPFDGSGVQMQSQGTTDLTSIATVASNENVESVVMPLSKIEVTIDGEESVPAMTFKRCNGFINGCAIANKSFCANLPSIQDLQGTFKYTGIGINANGLLGTNGVVLGAYGEDTLAESIMFQWADTQDGTGLLVSYTFYEWWGEGMRLRFRFKWGAGIEDLNNPESFDKIAVKIIHGNQCYFSGSRTWGSISPSQYTKIWNSDEGVEEYEIQFLPPQQQTPDVLKVEFYLYSHDQNVYIHTISDVEILNYESAADEYLGRNRNPMTRTISGSPSNTEGSVTKGYDINVYATHRLRYNSYVVIGTAVADIVSGRPNYPYLLTAQDRLQIDMKMMYQTPLTLYLNRFTLWGSNNKWRTIARTFRPWDDVHRFTFHHSTIFDY